MRILIPVLSTLLSAALPLAGQQQQPPPAGQTPSSTGQQQRRAPRPYADVLPPRTVTDTGGITVHHVDERWFFEVPDSLRGRDFLLVSRIAGVPPNFGGFTSAGTSVEEQVVRWERHNTSLLLRGVSFNAVADESLPIALSVASNNVGPIIGAFPIQAFGKDSASYVLDVTEFFAGDTPGISGLSPAQRRTYQIRRLDPARSYVSTIRAFPFNLEVRHTQTYDAGEPPSEPRSGTLSLEMRQSLVLLPREPMRPRHADQRVGFFTVSRVNYGLDEYKAATQRFIRRWRLEPKDPAAYARGELVEPVKPIVYYIDPATPAQWRKYVRQGIEDWQKPFEAAGFRNAILAADPPSRAEDPEWDPEDIRYSVVRWAASLVRNAVGPSTSDPRTGEIIESDITWYHNHLRSYRNRLVLETGAANPAARTLELDEAFLGETLRKVITHEVGHAIGLQHNMFASSLYPVDSLRNAAFVKRFGISATIMDYARQNYVAQPGDGLEPNDFIRKLGPFDDFIIKWGYRMLPGTATPEDERPTLNRWLMEPAGPWRYRYVPQFLSDIDPRAQTEDVGSGDPVSASRYGVANLRRVMTNLVAWTTKSGEDYEDLQELYGEALSMWGIYMGHVVTVVGGVHVDYKTADEDGAVYTPVPRAQQRGALRFLSEQVLRTPAWLAPDDILAKLGPPSGATSLLGRQTSLMNELLDARRLLRLAEPASPYSAEEYLRDLRAAVWGAGAADTSVRLDANRRALQRVYLERLETLVRPPQAAAATGPGGGGQGPPAPPPSPLVGPINVQRSDLPALARRELRAIQTQARAAATAGPAGVARAHWQDVVDRVDGILEGNRAR
jgi:hypothetical protein